MRWNCAIRAKRAQLIPSVSSATVAVLPSVKFHRQHSTASLNSLLVLTIGLSRDKAPVDEFIEKRAELGRTLLRAYLKFTEECVPQFGKTLWCFEAVPDRRGDLIETETFAGLRVEHHQLVADIGVLNSYGSSVAD